MSFEPQGGESCPAINPQNIVIYKTNMAVKDGEEELSHIQTPGLVVTPSRKVSAPAMAGTNARDDVDYPVMIQLVASDGQDRTRGLQTYTKWLQQIRRAFHARSWPEIDVAVYGDVRQSFAVITDVLDTRSWKKMPRFVAGVAVVFTVREVRGIEA